jgi:hypothetical protein
MDEKARSSGDSFVIFWLACAPTVYQKGTLLEDFSFVEASSSIEGHLYYPDLRVLGHFSWRKNKDGSAGQRCSYSQEDCIENSLGAWGVEVQALDRNDHTLDSSYVRQDGSFSLSVEEEQEVQIVFFLSHCSADTCFLFRDAQEAYALAHPTKPFVRSGKGYVLEPMLFQPEGVEAGVPNNHAHAANHFASLMELAFLWHGVGGAPFFVDDFAPLSVILPTSLDTNGRTTGPSTIHIPENTTGWIKGNKIMHEYGHVLSLRAWEGEYWFDGDAFADWSATTPQEPHIAFKEGFANFVSRSSQTTQGCLGSFDEPALLGDVEDGWLYPRNITQFLCDIYDYHQEGDENIHHPLSFFMEMLEEILIRAKERGDKRLSVCTWVETWVERENLSDQMREEIYILAEHNNFICP